MLLVGLGLLPSLHGHAALLGELLVLLQVSLGMLPSLLGNLAALFHAANVLDAIALLIGFLHVAVNKAVGGDSLAATLALLAVSAATAHLAFRLGVNLATFLVGAAADRPHASLGISVQQIVGFPPRGINRTLQGSGHAGDLVVHGLLGLLAIFHARLLGV